MIGETLKFLSYAYAITIIYALVLAILSYSAIMIVSVAFFIIASFSLLGLIASLIIFREEKKVSRTKKFLRYFVAYVWILFLLVIILFSLVQFNIIPPETFLPQTCVITTSGLSCVSLGVTSQNVSITIRNDLNKPIVVEEIKIKKLESCTGKFDNTIGSNEETTFVVNCDLSIFKGLISDFEVTYREKEAKKEFEPKKAKGIIIADIPEPPKEEKRPPIGSGGGGSGGGGGGGGGAGGGGAGGGGGGGGGGVVSFCSDCGNGLFNICDREECLGLGRCYFVKGVVTGTCGTCSASTACVNYDGDKITCANDPCSLGNCTWDSACQALKFCSDGTSYDDCSGTKPKYCSSGVLVSYCQVCGCPSGGLCQADGSCLQTCSDRTIVGSCSSSKPFYCSNGTLVNNCQACECPAEVLVSDDFEDNSMDSSKWNVVKTFGGFDLGPATGTVEEKGGYLRIYVHENRNAITYIQQAYAETKKDLNTGRDMIVEFDLEGSFTSGSIAFYISDGTEPTQWEKTGVNIGSLKKQGPLSQHLNAHYKVRVDSSNRKATLYKDGEIYQGYSNIDLSSLSKWYFRIFAEAAVSATTGDGDAEIKVHNFTISQFTQNCLEDGSCSGEARTCSDGTHYGSCSSSKPKLCSNGVLRDNCQTCGCDSGECQEDGTCMEVSNETPAANMVWTKYSGNPILAGDIEQPTIIFDGNEYKMYYLTAANRKIINLATSQEGINWIKYANNPVLTGTSGSWDGSEVWDPCVLYDKGVYKMWYAGIASWMGTADIGYATSSDGINWTKHSNNPVLIPDPESWESWRVLCDTVIKDEGVYKMWYSGRDGSDRIGYATSTDGITWEKYSGNPITDLGPHLFVIKDSLIFKTLHMCGLQLCYGTSQNGIDWDVNNIPALSGDPGTWDGGGTRGRPQIIKEGSFYKTWYSSYNSGYAIGYACGCIEGQNCSGCFAQVPTCSDNTSYNTCSVTKPKYCASGDLLNYCQICGCPVNQSCQPNGSCITPTCTDGTLYSQCSTTKPKYCSNGVLVNNCSACGCDSGDCPGHPDMAKIGSFCIDKYEASRTDATATNEGTDNTNPPKSITNVMPWTSISWYNANTACTNAGKRLCTEPEWEDACDGIIGSGGKSSCYGNTHTEGTCNEGNAGVCIDMKPTGSSPNCISDFGIYDLNGNAWELNSAIYDNGNRRGMRGGSECWGNNGDYGCSTADTRHLNEPAHDVGFRCCTDTP